MMVQDDAWRSTVLTGTALGLCAPSAVTPAAV